MENKTNYKRNANIELSKIVSLLGKNLGSVIKEQEGVSLYNKIEKQSSLLRNVTFHGPLAYRDIGSYYSRAKVFVNTSDSEGFPNSYLQAWIRGTPIMVFFDPDSMVAGNGLGYKAIDIQDMALNIRELLADKESWGLFSRQCKDYMEQVYGDDEVLKPYLESFNTVMK